MFAKTIIGLLLTALVTFFLSNALLDGPDPDGWWNFVPGLVFYASIWLALGLVIVWTVREVLIRPLKREPRD